MKGSQSFPYPLEKNDEVAGHEALGFVIDWDMLDPVLVSSTHKNPHIKLGAERTYDVVCGGRLWEARLSRESLIASRWSTPDSLQSGQ
jgi:hypothetical protein